MAVDIELARAPDTRDPALPKSQKLEFSAAEIGALAHLYRGEVYRSTVWRTRLDSTTNWAVVTTGIALSATFSSAEASPLPMVLVGLLVSVFLLFEARRYRYFNETWVKLLAKDYCDPRYHISFARAIGRRPRRTYAWIFVIQAVSYYGKLAIHPTPLTTLADVWERAAIGPIPGGLVVFAGVLFHGGWAVFALMTYRIELGSRRERRTLIAMG
jgi:uncharacterized membrane protein